MYTIKNILTGEYNVSRDDKDHCYNFEITAFAPNSKEMNAHLMMHTYGMNLFIGMDSNKNKLKEKIKEYYNNNYDMLVQLTGLSFKLTKVKCYEDIRKINFNNYNLVDKKVKDAIINNLINTYNLDIL